MGLLARALTYKGRRARQQDPLHSPDKHQIIGLLGRAQKIRQGPKGLGLGLLRTAERLRSEIERHLGLRARAEEMRLEKEKEREASQKQEKSAYESKAEESQEKGLRPQAKILEEKSSPPSFPSFLKSMEEEEAIKKAVWESIPSFSAPKSELSTGPSQKEEIQKQLQKRLEQYRVIFDIFKELQIKQDITTFWDTMCQAILSELGARSLVVFAETEQSKYSSALYPVHHLGLADLPKKRLKKTKGLIEHFGQKPLPIEKIPKNSLSINERRILKDLNTKAVFPLAQKDEIYALFFLGPSISEAPYSEDDLAFLELLSELGLSKFLEIQEQKEAIAAFASSKEGMEWQLELEHYKALLHLAHRANNLSELESIYGLISEYIDYYVSASMYSLILLSPEGNDYYIFESKGLSKESKKKYHLPISSNLIGSISNLLRIYHLDDFKENPEIKELYDPKDLEAMENYWILPLIHSHFLVGFISIHKMKNPNWNAIEHEIVLSLSEILSPYLANIMIRKSQSLTQVMGKPLRGMEKRLRHELKQAREKNTPLSILDLRILNIRAISEAMKAEQTASLFSQITQVLAKFLSQDDYLNRLELGHFAILFPQKNALEAKKHVALLASQLPKKIPPVRKRFSKKLDYHYKIISPDPHKAEIEKILRIFL